MQPFKFNFVFIICVIFLCLCSVHSRNVDNSNTKRTNENIGGGGGGGHNCGSVKPFFDLKNITIQSPHDSVKGSVCGGQCCGPDTELALRRQGQRVFATLLSHNSKSLQGLLDTTATTLQDHVTELARQSENKTLLLFSQVYRRMSVLSRDPISALYTDIRKYIEINGTFTTSSLDIKASITRFFTDLFPLVYHHAMNTFTKDFSSDYKVCLKVTINEIQPFGDIPRQVSQSLYKSLEATRLLLQAFQVGVEVLSATDTFLAEEGGKSNLECHEALLKMTYCPKCLGLSGDIKPCSGYCLNVLRGCLTKYVVELDSPWNSYAKAIERLVVAVQQSNNEAGVNADAVIRGLDTKISEAIMYAMENGPELAERVKRACGSAKLSDKEDPATVESLTNSSTSGSGGRSSKPQRLSGNMRVFQPPPEKQLSRFLNSISNSQGFYANLADSLCKYESFAETRDQNCWNGERIGEYSKVVVWTGVDMQKYNPEVTPNTNFQVGDPNVANLADKLRHVHNMVMSSVGVAGLPESDSFMQGDATDGSGSGHGGDFTDDSDVVDMRGSGSGDGPGGDRYDPHPSINSINGNAIDSSVDRSNKDRPHTGASSRITNSTTLCAALVLIIFFTTFRWME